MASQVLSGSGNPSYTNNTGQNVRVVIYFMSSVSSISWAGVSASPSYPLAIGRNVSTFTYPISQSATLESTEIILAPGQAFNATCGAYNIVVIPEAG